MLPIKAFVPQCTYSLAAFPQLKRLMLNFLWPGPARCSLQLPYKETINLNFSSQ